MEQKKTVPPGEWEKIRLIVCDLDGTMLMDNKQFSLQTKLMVQYASHVGVTVTFASGRMHPMLESYIDELKLNCPVITSNGGIIIHGASKEILWENVLSAAMVRPFLERCAAAGRDYCVLCYDESFFSENSRRIGRFLQYNQITAEKGGKQLVLNRVSGTSWFSRLEHQKICKLLVSCENEQHFLQTREWGHSVPELECTSSEPLLVDVMRKGSDKGSALEVVCRQMGLLRENVCVFGDYYNDLPMFARAGISVAMGNAPEDVKQKARFLCPNNNNDGIAKTVFQYILSDDKLQQRNFFSRYASSERS